MGAPEGVRGTKGVTSGYSASSACCEQVSGILMAGAGSAFYKACSLLVKLPVGKNCRKIAIGDKGRNDKLAWASNLFREALEDAGETWA